MLLAESRLVADDPSRWLSQAPLTAYLPFGVTFGAGQRLFFTKAIGKRFGVS